MTLSAEQIERIRMELQLNEVTLPLLRDDLLDHLCCEIENRMDAGIGFQTALADAIAELAPRGLQKIQTDTIELLHSKMIPMKKMTYTTGLISSVMMAVGALMNILHLPGAGNLSNWGIGTYGFLMFVALFLPLQAFSKYRSDVRMELYQKNQIRFGLISGFITMIAVMFKLMHLPGANLLMLTGAVSFIFGFLPFMFYGMYRRAL